jgi:hypothetical protein
MAEELKKAIVEKSKNKGILFCILFPIQCQGKLASNVPAVTDVGGGI